MDELLHRFFERLECAFQREFFLLTLSRLQKLKDLLRFDQEAKKKNRRGQFEKFSRQSKANI